MDRTATTIVDYATSLAVDDLPTECVEAAKLRLLDAVACAIVGFDSPTASFRCGKAARPRPVSAAVSSQRNWQSSA